MTQTKTHVRKLRNPDYIGSYELMSDNNTAFDLDVQISGVFKKEVHNGKKLEDCTIVSLVGQKPFILNVVNEKKLTKIFKTPFIEDWIGKSFTLYVAKIRFDGDTVDALRIRDILPTSQPKQENKVVTKPIFDNTNTKFTEAVDKIRNGLGTIEALKEHYIISPETEKQIKDLINEELL